MNSFANIRALAVAALLSAGMLSSGSQPSMAHDFSASGRAATLPAVTPSEPPQRGRAYLVRGFLGLIFSRGMNGLADQLKEKGVAADVYDFTSCDTVAEAAAQDYHQAPAPVVLIGHSMGGRCALQVAARLREAQIPVSLLVTVDPVHASPDVPDNVERYINIFLSDSLLGGGDVKSEQDYRGHYASFDLASHGDMSHITIDKSNPIHDQLIAKIVQLAMTPSRNLGETTPLRYIVPRDTPVELWDSGIPVLVRPGDTLETIAAAHRVPLWSIVQINPHIGAGALIPGERIIVPRYLVPAAAMAKQGHPRR